MADMVDGQMENVIQTVSSQLAVAMKTERDKIVLDGVAELKHIHAETMKVENAIKSVATVQTNSLNVEKTILTAVQQLSTDIADLKAESKRASKIASLQWAITNSDKDLFVYQVYQDGDSTRYINGNLVKNILLAFMRNCGECVEEDFPEYRKATTDINFEAALIEQIHRLTGVKPRITDHKGRRYIWYV